MFRGSAFVVLLSVSCAAVLAAQAPQNKRDDGKWEVSLRARSEVVAPKVLAALVEHDIPVASAQGGVIQATLPKERGVLGEYEITVHAFVLPSSDSTTTLRMWAEENLNAGSTRRTYPVNWMSRGRSGKVWKALTAAVDAVADSTATFKLSK